MTCEAPTDTSKCPVHLHTGAGHALYYQLHGTSACVALRVATENSLWFRWLIIWDIDGWYNILWELIESFINIKMINDD